MELTVDNTNIPIPNNSEMGLVTLNLFMNRLESSACDSLGGDLSEFSNDEFTAIEFNILLYECNYPETRDFQNAYFYEFYSGYPTNQTFTFNYILDAGPNEEFQLTIINGGGDTAIYGNAALSIQDNTFSQFTLFPNPAKNELFLNSKNTTGNLKLKIFNIEGKLLSTQTVAIQDQTSIDVSNLSSGMYFLNIEDENGSKAIKRFLKE